jgi:hypothetical protein
VLLTDAVEKLFVLPRVDLSGIDLRQGVDWAWG